MWAQHGAAHGARWSQTRTVPLTGAPGGGREVWAGCWPRTLVPRGLRPEGLTLPKSTQRGRAWAARWLTLPRGKGPPFPQQDRQGRRLGTLRPRATLVPRSWLTPEAPVLLAVLGGGGRRAGRIPTLAVTMCSPKCRIRSPCITRGNCSSDSRGSAAPSRRKHR